MRLLLRRPLRGEEESEKNSTGCAAAALPQCRSTRGYNPTPHSGVNIDLRLEIVHPAAKKGQLQECASEVRHFTSESPQAKRNSLRVSHSSDNRPTTATKTQAMRMEGSWTIVNPSSQMSRTGPRFRLMFVRVTMHLGRSFAGHQVKNRRPFSLSLFSSALSLPALAGATEQDRPVLLARRRKHAPRIAPYAGVYHLF